MTRLIIAVALFAALLAPSAMTAQPVVSRMEPHGIKRGEPTKVILHGARLKDARHVLADLPGLTVSEVKPLSNNQVEISVEADADLPPGQYPIRLVTDSGISNLRLLGVGAMPVLSEEEPNSEFESPQKIDLNVTIEGLIKTEDQDFFAVDMKAGQTLTVECEGVRMANTQRNNFLDPYVAIVDAGRFEVASSDDHPLLQQDAVCSYKAEEDGTYVVLIRDSSFGGNNEAYYRLHVGTFPRPVAVIPAGGQTNEILTADLIDLDGNSRAAQVTLPSEPHDRYPVVTETEDGITPSPNWIRVNELPVTVETEPNDDRSKAPEAEIPGALCGVIGEPDDVDYFGVDAVKGRKYYVQLYAREILRSPLDGVINVFGPDNGRIGGNDDSGGKPDSYLEFTAKADGRHTIQLSDHLGAGGPHYAYRIEVTEAKPSLSLDIAELDRDQAVSIPVPQGGQMAVRVTASRKDFGGELTLETLDLPPGIEATVFPMRADRTEVPILLTAAGDAEKTQSLVDLVARPTDEKLNELTGRLDQPHKLVLGQNRRSIYEWNTNRVAVSVAEKLPFKLIVDNPQVPITRRGNMEVMVRIEREEGFEGEVSLRSLYNPPGISVNNSRKIAKDKNEVAVPMTANASAALGEWPLFLIATTGTDNGSARMTTQPIPVLVEDSFFSFSFQKSAAEQGAESELAVGLEINREFEGEAEVEIVGLPPGVSSSAPKQKITPETTQLTFPITIAEDARPGTHKTLNCRASIVSEKGTILETQGTGELRVDKPLPPKADEPEKKEVKKEEPKKPEPAKEKPLSRLEQLRKMKQES
ncbi:MAG: serine protease [Pirellulaceae bacterium]